MDGGGLRKDVDRLARRLAEHGPARLASAGDVDAGVTLADTAHAVAQALADAAADADRHPHRLVPRLADRAVADQVAVTGHDLVEALARHGLPVPDVVAVRVRNLADRL